MADPTTITQYEISGSIGNDSFGFSLTTDGLTDASVLAFCEAIKGITWPTGISCSVWSFKSITTTTTTQGNLAASPPAFG